MDARLLLAISDVLSGDDTAGLVSGGVSATESASAARQSVLRNASTKNASTGTPIPLLRGVAAERATLSNVGGGAKSAGGGGMEGGQKVLTEAELKVQLAVYGIKAIAISAQIAMRYAQLVRHDQNGADEAGADSDKSPSP